MGAWAVRISTLNLLNNLTTKLKGINPVLIVMGDVVKLREELLNTVESVAELEGI